MSEEKKLEKNEEQEEKVTKSPRKKTVKSDESVEKKTTKKEKSAENKWRPLKQTKAATDDKLIIDRCFLYLIRLADYLICLIQPCLSSTLPSWMP